MENAVDSDLQIGDNGLDSKDHPVIWLNRAVFAGRQAFLTDRQKT